TTANLPNDKRQYEKNRNPLWPGTELPACVRRAGKPKNRRQRYLRRVCTDRQSDPGRTDRLRGGDRSHLAGRAVLSRVAQERGAHRLRGGEQPVLVERRREIF